MTAFAVGLALSTAGCGGSAVSPETVRDANVALYGGAIGNGQNGPVVEGSDPNNLNPDTTNSPGENSGNGPTAENPSGPGGNTGGPGTSNGQNSSNFGGVKAGSCAGFKNGPGITNTTIRIGSAADVSGPLPGLFRASQQATSAYVAYFNSTNPKGICGRKLVLDTYDTKTDAGANQVAYTKMCSTDFASVGSMSAFDSGAGPVAQKCGIPALHSAAVTATFNQCSTCFGIDATGQREFSNEAYDFWVRNEKAATTKAAFLYINTGAAAENAKTQIAVGKKRGINWIYTAGIDVAEFNYGPYVQKLKDQGVQMVQFLGGWQMEVRFLQALQQANYKPKVRLFDPSAYEPGFLEGGPAVEGAFMYLVNVPLDENQAEMNLYKRWLSQVAPGVAPTFFGTFSWSAAKLFVEQAVKLGGRLNRANMVSAIRGMRTWEANGLHGPMDVGQKHPASCMRYMVVKDKKFVPYKGTKYRCGGFSRA